MLGRCAASSGFFSGNKKRPKKHESVSFFFPNGAVEFEVESKARYSGLPGHRPSSSIVGLLHNRKMRCKVLGEFREDRYAVHLPPPFQEHMPFEERISLGILVDFKI